MLDEKIIMHLEEIDSTFFKINRVLRDIQFKTEKIHKTNKTTINNLQPWLNFFGFQTSSSIKTMDCQDETGILSERKSIHEFKAFESDESELLEFNLKSLPEIFQNETEIVKVYKFVLEKEVTSINEVLEEYECDKRKKILIFIDLLVNKNFIRNHEGTLKAK